MASETKMVIVSREIVKPSSESHNKIHHLSFFDRLSPCVYIPIVFFYPNDTIYGCNFTANQSIRILRDSLSAVLHQYYPLAGRMRDIITVDCNDDGVVFLEAEMNCELSELLKNPTSQSIRKLCPDGLEYKDSTLSSPLVVQVTIFSCRSMAFSVCMCHKILDMAGMCSFLNSWATRARNSGETAISPEFNFASIFPAHDLPSNPLPHPEKEITCISRRFVFNASKIDKLKVMVANEVKNPTKVEVVTALLYSCAISATRTRLGVSKPTVMHQAVNLRSWLTSSFNENYVGNFTGSFAVLTEENSEIDMVWLVREIRKARLEYCNTCAKKFDEGQLSTYVLESSIGLQEFHRGRNQDVYACTSWCKFPLYEIDFGWGKPVWVTTAVPDLKNVIQTIDSRDGDGIEAIVSLEAADMALFERNEKLTAFASVNPNVITDDNTSASRLDCDKKK